MKNYGVVHAEGHKTVESGESKGDEGEGSEEDEEGERGQRKPHKKTDPRQPLSGE